MQIKEVPISTIIPYEKNAKKHNATQIKNVAESIRQFGFVQPLVLTRENVIVIGHCRLEAAKLLGMESVPCYLVEDLTEEQVRKLRNLDNKLNESDWDFELLAQDIEGLTFDDFDIDWNIPEETDEEEYERKKQEFQRRMEDGELSEDSEEYQEFLQKFEAKKTTDDCYTHPNIYEAVADFVEKEYGVEKKNFVRPFYPGGDYQNEKYKPKDIVVDNPPFSIISEICRWYSQKGIKFFLFAPSLTIFAIREAQKLCCGVSVTYENGANVSTSFVTNMGDCEIRSCPELYQILKKVNDQNLKERRKELPKYDYPSAVITSTRLAYFSKYGQKFAVKKENCKQISELESQKKAGKAIFGGGYLISKTKSDEAEEKYKAAAEKAAAEKAVAEKAVAEKWKLSAKEIEIIKSLE